MSFGALSAQREGGAGPRRDGARHVDDDRRRRHDARRARVVEDAGLPVPAVALWIQSRRRAPRRRDRDRDRPGRQARRRRHAARAEGQSARREDAHACPQGVDQRSASRHPDWTGPDDLAIKINELREITDWEKPIYVKVGATRVYHDVKLAVHAGADVIVVDGMQGGTAATQTVLHRTRRHSDAGRGAPGGRGARRPEHARQGAAHRLRRHPHRRRCGQGARHGRRCGGDRPGRADGARLQQRELPATGDQHVSARRGLRAARHGAGLLPSLPHRPLSRWASPRRTRCSSSAWSRESARSACTTT